MSSDNLQTLLDATAGDLVTADYDSAQDVIALCGRVEKLRDATTAAGHRRIPNALSRALALINAIVTDETCDRAAVLDTLNKLFSAIQYALRPGSDPEKLRLPAGTMSDAAAHAAASVHRLVKTTPCPIILTGNCSVNSSMIRKVCFLI